MENQKASSRQRALSLVDMSSAFIVLGLGLCLAFLVFLLEVIYKRIQIHRVALLNKTNKGEAYCHAAHGYLPTD